MLDVYYKQIRCILEMAVAVWLPGLTKAESMQIERVQKCALNVILGDLYVSYDTAVDSLEVEKLSERRPKLYLNFALGAEKSQKYKNLFCPTEFTRGHNTRSDKMKTKYKPVPHRTNRFVRSPIPYLTDLLNEYHGTFKIQKFNPCGAKSENYALFEWGH